MCRFIFFASYGDSYLILSGCLIQLSRGLVCSNPAKKIETLYFPLFL